MDPDAIWYGPRPRPHCVRWEPSSPKKGHSSPQFSSHVYCGQTAGWIKMPFKTEVGLGSGDIALDGEPVPQKKHSNPHFSAHVYCRQTAGCIQMPFGTDHGPGHTVLDGNPAPPKRGIAAPNFRTISIVVKRLGGFGCHLVWKYAYRPRLHYVRWRYCVRWGPSSPRERVTHTANGKGHSSPSLFDTCLSLSSGAHLSDFCALVTGSIA